MGRDEQLVIKKFEEFALRKGYKVFKGQGKENRIDLNGDSTYFQFGDLRVETKDNHVVIEVESAGGVTNLVKYWYCIAKELPEIKKPIILFHIFLLNSEHDYQSHLWLWKFLWEKMKEEMKGKIEARLYPCKGDQDLEEILEEFKKIV